MARYADKTAHTKQSIDDLVGTFTHVVELLHKIKNDMEKNDLLAFDSRNESSGRDGVEAVSKWISAMEEGFLLTLAQRTVEKNRQKSLAKITDDKKSDQAIEAAEKAVKKRLPKR